MLSPSLPSVLGLMATVTLLASAPAAHSANTDNCRAANPTLKGAAMSEKLRRCNGVLKPSKAADPDIIIPTPSINDPLMIHPKRLPGNKGVPK
jgi:hypothetical protein